MASNTDKLKNELQECTQMSFLAALMNAAQLGLYIVNTEYFKTYNM